MNNTQETTNNTPSQVIANALKLIEDLKEQNKRAEEIVDEALLKIQQNNQTIEEMESYITQLNVLSNSMHILSIAQYSFAKKNRIDQ